MQPYMRHMNNHRQCRATITNDRSNCGHGTCSLYTRTPACKRREIIGYLDSTPYHGGRCVCGTSCERHCHERSTWSYCAGMFCTVSRVKLLGNVVRGTFYIARYVLPGIGHQCECLPKCSGCCPGRSEGIIIEGFSIEAAPRRMKDFVGLPQPYDGYGPLPRPFSTSLHLVKSS